MAKNVTVTATIDDKPQKIKVGALNYMQSRAIKKKHNKLINMLPPELRELEKKEQKEGLSPEEMEKILVMTEEIEDAGIPVQLEAIRMGLAKHDKEWIIPTDTSDSEAGVTAHSALVSDAHDRLMEMFTKHEIDVLYNFVVSGTINPDSIQAQLSDVDLT